MPRPVVSAGDVVAEIGGRLDGSPVAIMLDIDGTIAAIAPTPPEVEVSDEMRSAIERIAILPDVHLALVSGRAAENAWQLAGVAGAWVIGNHGFEVREPDGTIVVSADVRAHEATMAAAAKSLELLRWTPGVIVEDKHWTLSVHYRGAASHTVPSLTARARSVAAELGLRVTEGKKVLEVRPPVLVDKGSATLGFARRAGAVVPGGSILYAGDDRTDEDAFRALREGFPGAVTLRVAGMDSLFEPTAAEFDLESPDELRVLLQWLAGRRARRS